MEETEIDLLISKVGPDKAAHLLALGPTLRAVRGFLDITQAELAASCNLSKRTIIKLEKGLFALDYMTFAAVTQGLKTLGVQADIRSGRLEISISARDVNAGLGKIAAAYPNIPIISQFVTWMY